MKDVCANCRFGNGTDVAGLCQRHPPKVIVLHGEALSLWPEVRLDDWCGDFKSDVEREADEDWNKMVAEE